MLPHERAGKRNETLRCLLLTLGEGPVAVTPVLGGYLAKYDIDTICWHCNLLRQKRAQHPAQAVGLTGSQRPDILRSASPAERGNGRS